MLMVPFSSNVDVFAELERIMPESFEVVILQGTLDELEDLTHKAESAKTRNEAKMALKLVESKRKHLKVVSVSAEYVDDQIVQFARASEGNVYIATQDLDLRTRLKALGNVTSILLRQRRHLVLER